MNFLKSKIIIFVGIFACLCLCSYFLLGFFAGYYFTAERISKIVKNETGLSVVLKNSKIRTMPDFSILMFVDTFAIGSPDASINILSAKNVDLRVKIFPLFFKNLSISSFSSSSLEINVLRDKNGKFNFEKFLMPDKDFSLKLKLKNANIDFNDFHVAFIDKKNNRNIILSAPEFLLKANNHPNKIFLNTKTNIKVCTLDNNNCQSTDIAAFLKTGLPLNKYLDSKDTNFNVNVNNFSTNLFLPYVNEFSPVKFENLTSKVNFSFKKNQDSLNNAYLLDVELSDVLADFLLNNKKSTISLKNSSKLNISFSADKNAIKLSNSSFFGKDLNVVFSGLIKNYKSDKFKPDINLKIQNSDFMKFIRLIPAGAVVYKTDLINELLKSNPHAVVNAQLNVSGNYLRPDIKGSASVSDLYLFERPKNFKTANVKCNFIGDKVNVDVIVFGPNNQFVKVWGYSEIYDKQAGDYEVISSDAVDLAFAHKYLIPVQRVIGFKLGPLPYMKLSGVGKIHIKTRGTIYDAIVEGKFFGKNITASMQGLNTVLKKGKIELDFNGKVINIVDTSADMSGGNFTLFGYADDYNNLDVTAKITNVQAGEILKIAKTSELVKPFSGDLSFIKSASGKVNLNILFKGKAKSLEGVDFLSDIKPSGEILLNAVNAVIMPNLHFKNINGKIAFSDKFNVDIKSDFNGAKTSAAGIIKPTTKDLTDKNAKFKIDIQSSLYSMLFSQVRDAIRGQKYFNNKNLKFLLTSSPLSAVDFLFNVSGNIKGEISSDFSNPDFSKLSFSGVFAPVNSSRSKNISFIDGKYIASGSKILVENSHIKFFGADIFADGQIANINKNPQANLKILANSVSIDGMQTYINNSNIQLFKALLADFVDYKGSVNLNLNIRKNTPYGNVTFNNISMYNKKQQIPLQLKSGGIKFAGSRLNIDAFNFSYGNTPIYFNASLKDYLSSSPMFNAMYSTNIDEYAADKLINPYLTYPFKVKGEIRLKGRIKGDFNNYSLISYLTLPRDTDITYMGANVGDIQYDREFEAKADFTKNVAKINSAKYVKYIPSQNNKPTPITMLKAYGKVVFSGKNLNFENFKIATPNPVTAKIFNVMFKKSVLKQGLFTCDLTLNGDVLLPHAIGKINFSNINIPLYSTKISDLDCDVSKNIINATLRGKSFDSDVEMVASVLNKQTLPIVVKNLNITSKKTSLSQLIEGISQLPKGSSDIVPGEPIILKPKDLIILNGEAFAQDIELYDIKANNLKMNFSNPTGDMLNINNMSFDIADGTITSKGNFDISSLLFDIDSVVNDCDANILSTNFLGLQNQIYGRTNAKINLKGKIPENAQDIKLVSGNVNFSVNNGKMPKLGSLEYLLRAGNLIKSGIFGLTLNNLIEVLTPYKTGEFSAIRGSFDVYNGKISSLEIFSKGNNLSLFIYGGYDIINDNADIEILGRLSKKVSNVLGAAGNASLNTLFATITGNKIKEGAKSQIIENVNRIPLIEISGDDYRLFLAKIKGKLNSDDYVKSFNWLN